MKIIEIEDCRDCPHGKLLPPTDFLCGKVGMIIYFPDNSIPPSWCPLEEVTEPGDSVDPKSWGGFCEVCGVQSAHDENCPERQGSLI